MFVTQHSPYKHMSASVAALFRPSGWAADLGVDMAGVILCFILAVTTEL